jgi:hypothetical protein
LDEALVDLRKAEALNPGLTTVDASKLDPRAYDLYLRGSYHIQPLQRGEHRPSDRRASMGVFKDCGIINLDFLP